MLNTTEKKYVALAIYFWYKLTAKNKTLPLLSVQAMMLARMLEVTDEYEALFRTRNPDEKIVSFEVVGTKEEFLKQCEAL